ncbi:ATP-binding protein [Actinomyces sp. B33]|uniref:sensor histidine kinase n=1 Tax=Actinomyces sp. B33 TaxID=2942131 RepID=UPI00234020D7|nr:ATP-binding protein [Actinomyces sp. B33]MDC4232376.1 ATP-binding protein [Actinomyces sp. B33]
MPEIVTLIIVAALGVVVGAVGVGAYRVSQRQMSEAPPRNDADEQGLSPDALAILSALPHISLVLDADRTIMRADAAAYAKGLARGRSLDHERLIGLVDRVGESGTAITEDLELPRSSVDDAALLDFRIRVAPLPKGRSLILVEDRTIQRRNEESRRDFTANVSHELKTPVGAVRLLAETIAANPDDAGAVAHFAPKLVSEADRLSHLVTDIIDLSRLEAPDPLAAARRVDIDEVVSSALDRETTPAAAADIDLVRPSAPSRARVWGDRDMLVTAVRNLVDNAIRYSPPGSCVGIDVQADEDVVRISVVDSGVGISAEEQERIFERFYRVDPARSRNTGGTGLGLSIVKHIASDHGGAVAVWSSPGRGSTFTLVLPLVDIGAPAHDAPLAPGRSDQP